MRLNLVAVLGLLVPGCGHLVTGRRRRAAIFLLPVVVLVVAVVVAAGTAGGIYGLIAIVVTPGVLPALALLNVALAAWRLLSGADLLRAGRQSIRDVATFAVLAAALVIAPHVVVGRAIASTNDLLDSMFASEPAPLSAAGPGPTAESTPMVEPTVAFEGSPTPTESAPPTAPASDEPSMASSTPTPSPRRVVTGGGNSSDPLPPLGAAVPWSAPGALPWGSDGRFDLLLLGSDAGSDRWSRRMDVMLLVEVDVASGEVAMVGLPRNLTNAPFPAGPARNAVACGCLRGLLNEAYGEAVWNHPERWPGSGAVKGIGAVRAMVSELTGRPIDAVLVADLMGVVRVIDAMGGIDVTVPSSVFDANYPDPVVGDTTLSIRAGRQHMTGRTALAYARSRHQDSDYGRMERQQILLLAIRAALGPATILAAPNLVAAAKGAAWTDLPRSALPNLVQLFGRAAGGRVHQLRIVPPAYPEQLTPIVVARIHAAVAALLPPVSAATPSPHPNPSQSPAPSGPPPPSPLASAGASAAPSRSPSLPPSPTATAGMPPAASPAASASASGSAPPGPSASPPGSP